MPSYPGPDLPEKATRAQREAYTRRLNDWIRGERARAAAQRAAFRAAMGPARAVLEKMMLDRAWALLDAGEWEAADALLEFLPEASATALLDEFFPDS